MKIQSLWLSYYMNWIFMINFWFDLWNCRYFTTKDIFHFGNSMIIYNCMNIWLLQVFPFSTSMGFTNYDKFITIYKSAMLIFACHLTWSCSIQKKERIAFWKFWNGCDWLVSAWHQPFVCMWLYDVYITIVFSFLFISRWAQSE